jgi:hypothetical protein
MNRAIFPDLELLLGSFWQFRSPANKNSTKFGSILFILPFISSTFGLFTNRMKCCSHTKHTSQILKWLTNSNLGNFYQKPWLMKSMPGTCSWWVGKMSNETIHHCVLFAKQRISPPTHIPASSPINPQFRNP